MAERLNQDNFESRVLQSEKLALVDFYSDSCAPCKRMSPILAELEEEHAGQLFVGKVNIVYDTELAGRYEVLSAPTLIFFKNGEVQTRFTGLTAKEELEKFINQNI